MEQLISKIVDAIIENCMLKDLSYKGKNYQKEKKLIISTTNPSNEELINLKGKSYIFTKCDNEEQLVVEEGVYIFVAKKNFSFLIKEAFIKFASIKIENNEIKLFYPCTPKINFFSDEKETTSDSIAIKKGELIYVGEAKNIKNRYNRHYSSHINKTSALKLGLRDCIKDNVDFYYTAVKDKERSNLEKAIRDEFCPRFGE